MSRLSGNGQSLAILLSLGIVVLVSFWPVIDCDFVNFDDDLYVTGNDHVREGLTADSVRWAFTTTHNANWFPLTWLSHMLDVQLFGLDARWHHLTNLLLHVANTLLLFLVLHRMSGAPWQSAFVAAAFGVHPLHVESVAWVAERKDVLAALFWMLTLLAYCLYVERPKLQRYLLVVLLFALGLMSKPMLVTLPFVLLLLDFWPLQRLGKATNGETGAALGWDAIRPLIREKLPLFYLTLLSIFVTYRVQQAGGAVVPIETMPLGLRISNALVSYLGYLRKTLWPSDLAVFYPYPSSFPAWQVLGSALLLVAISTAVVWKARRAPYLMTGWLWYLGTLVPVIGLVQVGRQSMADRYTYIPSIGLFIVVAWGVPELLRSWRHRRLMLAVASTAVLVALCIATSQQTRHWQSSIALFGHALDVTRDNYVAHYNRGAAYSDLGRHEQAIVDFDAAIGINPKDAMIHDYRGVAHAALGHHDQAIRAYDEAIALSPTYSSAYYNRGLSELQLGKDEAAIDDFTRAIELDPMSPNAYYNRALVLLDLGNPARAVEDLRIAARLGHEDAQDTLRRERIEW